MSNNILYLLCISLFLSFNAFCQPNTDTLPPYLKNKYLPHFTLQTPDSSLFTEKELPNGRPFVLINFSTGCGHCKAKAKLMAKNIDSLGDAFVLWVGYNPLDSIRYFANLSGLDTCKNVVIGRDIHYFFPVFFQTKSTPFIAIYGRDGQFVKEFRYGAYFHDIVVAVKGAGE